MEIFSRVMRLRGDSALHPWYNDPEHDVDVALKEDLVTAGPPDVDADLGDVNVCERAHGVGCMGLVQVEGSGTGWLWVEEFWLEMNAGLMYC